MPLLIPPLRKRLITASLLKFYTKLLPPLSDTERTALESGTVGFEGELFSGKPDWDQVAVAAQAAIERRRTGVPRWPGAKTCAG